MKFGIPLIALVISTTGCATSAVSVNEAKSVPTERVFRVDALPAANNARAVFVRDTGFSGGGVYQHLYIDGKKAASLNPGEKVEFVLPPGEHILGAIPTDAFSTHSLNTIDQDLKADKIYFYRIQMEGNSFRTTLQRFVPDYQ